MLLNFPFWLTCLLLFLFAAFRRDVGADFHNYYNIFIEFGLDSAPFDFEPLNMLIIDAINYIGLTVYFIFFIYSMITLFSVYYFVVKLSDNQEVSLAIFFLTGMFYLSTLNGIRQWSALALILIAIVKFIDRKLLTTFFVIILASLFHKSAIIMLFLFFFNYRVDIKRIFLVTVCLLFLLKSITYVISISGYSRYLIEGLYTQSISTVLLLTYTAFLMVAPIVLGYFNKTIILDRKITILINMNFASILILAFGFMSGMSAVSVMRMNMYFQMQVIVLIPLMLSKIQPVSLRKLAYILLLSSLSLLFFYTLIENGEIYKLTPYNTFLDTL